MSNTMKLGATGPELFHLGLGCMGMSDLYGVHDEAESLRTLHAALDAGVTLFDTGDFYGMGHNELLLGRALAGRRERALVSVKFGAMRGPDGSWLGNDGRPAAVKNFAAYSLKRLGVDVIDIYRPARLDPNVPIEDTIGAIADLVKAGYVRHIGLSEVGVATIRRAAAVAPIVDLQIEYSIASRAPEGKLFAVLRELGISATLYGVFSRGLLTGSRPQGSRDFRSHLPRFSGDAGIANQERASALARFAAERGSTAGRVLLGWVLAKQPGFLPLVGARRLTHLDDALGATALSEADVTALEALLPPGAIEGTRYHVQQMAHLDSERDSEAPSPRS